MVGPRPAAVDPPRSLPRRPACALLRGGPRHGHRHERAEAAGEVGARDAREAGVDDRADARHGEAALGDGRREHHPAPALDAARPQRGVLGSGGQGPVQRQDVDPVEAPAPAQPAGDGRDLARAGEEHEDVPRRSPPARAGSPRPRGRAVAGRPADRTPVPRAAPGAPIPARAGTGRRAPRPQGRSDRWRRPAPPRADRSAPWPTSPAGAGRGAGRRGRRCRRRVRGRCRGGARGTRRAPGRRFPRARDRAADGARGRRW